MSVFGSFPLSPGQVAGDLGWQAPPPTLGFVPPPTPQQNIAGANTAWDTLRAFFEYTCPWQFTQYGQASAKYQGVG